MINYIALFIGHALLAIALLQLVQREALDVDPLLSKLAPEKKNARKNAKPRREQVRKARPSERQSARQSTRRPTRQARQGSARQ